MNFWLQCWPNLCPCHSGAYISENSTHYYMYLSVFIYFLSNLRNTGDNSQRVVSCSNFCPLCDLKELVNLSDVISIVGEMQSFCHGFPESFLNHHSMKTPIVVQLLCTMRDRVQKLWSPKLVIIRGVFSHPAHQLVFWRHSAVTCLISTRIIDNISNITTTPQNIYTS